MSTTRARVLAALCALAPLAGCRSGYDLDVRNLTDQPVTARLQVPFSDGAPVSKVERYIGPGDRQHMFYQADYITRVTLAVDFAGNVAYPATLDLSRGQTVVNVRRADQGGAQGKLQLEEVPRP